MRTFIIITLIFLTTATRAAPNMDFSFNMGPSINQSGDIDKLGSSNMNTGFTFNYFFKEQHGLGAAINSEFTFDGSDELRTVDDASISTFDIHYTFRKVFSPKFHLLISPGIGWQTLYEYSQDYYWGYTYLTDLSTAWMVNYSIMLHWIVSEWLSGENEMNLFLGAGIQQFFSFNDDYKGEDISGSRLNSIFRIGLGF